MYICVTHVDSKTGISCIKAPTINGPKYPDIQGLVIEWWDQSVWPTKTPKYYGTCDDGADVSIEGVMYVFKDVINPVLDENGESIVDSEGRPVTETITAEQQYLNAQAEEMRARLPSVASPRQIRLALLELGLLEDITTMVNSLEEPLKTKVMIEWEYATEINKNNPTIQQLYNQLGLTEEQLDEVFVVASKIQ